MLGSMQELPPVALLCGNFPSSFRTDVEQAAPADTQVPPVVRSLEAAKLALVSRQATWVIGDSQWPAEERDALKSLALDYAAGWCELTSDSSQAEIAKQLAAAKADRGRRINAVLFSALAKLTADNIYAKDRELRIIECSQSMADKLGVASPAQLRGRSDRDFFTAEHAGQAEHDEREILRTGEPIKARLEKETKEDGTVSWCMSWKGPLHDADGRLIGVAGLSRDVTTTKTIEVALATERHLISALLTGLPDSVFIKDREGRFILANNVIASWKGITPAEMKGKTVADFYPPDVAESIEADDRAIMETGMPIINREERITLADGRDLWVLTSKLPYRSPEGEIIGLIGISRNISLRHGIQERLLELQTENDALRKELESLKTAQT